MIIIKINYKKKLNPLTIESMEASMVHIHDIAGDKKGVQYKMGKEWMDFRKIFTREAVLDDSLFLRFMRTSITRNSNDFSKEFIVMKFSYDAEYRLEDGEEQKMSKEELRTFYYKNGVTFQSAHTGKHGKTEPIHYKMLYRTSGKAKKGECIFVRDNLFHKAINYLTMGFYDLMEEKAKADPDTVFKLVELSAYLSLTTACAIGYIPIPLKNILVVEDQSAYTKPMAAEIVKVANVPYENDEFVLEFDDPRMETILNNHQCTLDKDKAAEKGWSYIKERTKEELKKNGIRINGKYPGHHESIPYTVKECVVEEVEDAKIENILWDGMGLIDESIFPKYANGFVYCRSHFFKSCLFRGNVQEYFKDYCKEHEFDFETYEVTDMFGNKKKVSDIKVVITDKSLKWLKFTDMMGGTKQKAYRTYQKLMNEYENVFAVVKTAHKSKWDNLQLSTYQMNNSLPCTDKKILGEIVGQAIDFINGVKDDDKNYLKYLEMTKSQFNLNEFLVDLVNRNPEFVKTEFFRKKKKKDVYKLVDDFKKGRLPQQGDNLTIMGNPIALLMKAVGENPLEENIFDVEEDAIQCYTERFMDGENLAAFRSPHNSPNNILHFHNIKSEKISKYFPNLGENIIIINLIGTDAQARGSGFDEDSDFVFVTNQSEVVELARQAYVEYPTIINEVEEMKSTDTKKSTATINSMWSELNGKFPNLFPDNITNQADQLNHALSVWKQAQADIKKISAENMNVFETGNVDSRAFSEVTDEIEKVQSYIETIQEDSEIDPDVKTEKLQHANEILEYLVQKQQELGQSDIEITVNADELESKINDAKSALGEFKNEGGTVDISLSGAQDAVDNLQTLLYQKENAH